METVYVPQQKRYSEMKYRRCGNSGLLLPEMSLGIWQNFSDSDPYERSRNILLKAFDCGITHFDAANNYGRGSAEETLGKVIARDLKPYRDELIISTKAGYDMWPGPYGNGGSRKYLLASLDQSLKRLGLDYVDIFYSHRPDYDTPLEETMGALAQAVHQGKALYVGLSNYPAELSAQASDILASLGVHCLIHQPRYSMIERTPEKGLLDVLKDKGIGCIAFQALGQGLLTNRYINGIPSDSRIGLHKGTVTSEKVTPKLLSAIKKLDSLAKERNQTLAQMALSWVLKDERITSLLVGVSTVAQLEENLKSLDNLRFTSEEISIIDTIFE